MPLKRRDTTILTAEIRGLRTALEGVDAAAGLILAQARKAAEEATAARDEIAALTAMLQDALKGREAAPEAAPVAPSPILRPARAARAKTAAKPEGTPAG